MVISSAHYVFVFLLFIGAIRAVVSRDRRGLLWGSSLTTAGLVGTLWISGIGAVTSLLAIIFLLFDFAIFTFSGSTKLLPNNKGNAPKSSRVYPALVVWLMLTFIAAGLYLIWVPEWVFLQPSALEIDKLLSGVLRDFWGKRAFFLYLIVGLIFAVAVGSFFMIEREKQNE